MDANEVETIIDDMIVHLGLPFRVLSVIASPAGWNILVRAGTRRLVRFAVPSGQRIAMRVAIQKALAGEP